MNSALERAERRRDVGPRRAEGVRLPAQVMLEDAVDHVDVVEDAQHDDYVLRRQPLSGLADRLVEAEVGPTLDPHELTVGLVDRHGALPYG